MINIKSILDYVLVFEEDLRLVSKMEIDDSSKGISHHITLRGQMEKWRGNTPITS